MSEQQNKKQKTAPAHAGQSRSTGGGAEYRRGDGPALFPMWSVLIAFFLAWPLAFVMLGVNLAVKNGWMESPLEGLYTPSGRRRRARTQQSAGTPVYARETPQETGKTETAEARLRRRERTTAGVLTVVGALMLGAAVLSMPDALYWLGDAIFYGGDYARWVVQDSLPTLSLALGGAGCLWGAQRVRTGGRLRRRIAAIVGDAPYMYIEDIAGALNCGYDKCCRHLENCIDKDVFGEDAYLDLSARCLVVRERPALQSKPAQTAAKAAAPAPEKDDYQHILEELRAVNNAIPGEEMSDKIARLEQVAEKIFAQAKADPDKLPKMRRFMDYYLPTSLKLLKTYAELDAQEVEGANITESKRRIEATMDTLVTAFERQLDDLFRDDALDVSADIDVMQQMLRADGLTGDRPFDFGLGQSTPGESKL